MNRGRLLILFAYLFLALCGLGIPLAHRQFGEQIFEASPRAGGPHGLHKGTFLLLRDIGFLAWFFPLPAFWQAGCRSVLRSSVVSKASASSQWQCSFARHWIRFIACFFCIGRSQLATGRINRCGDYPFSPHDPHAVPHKDPLASNNFL